MSSNLSRRSRAAKRAFKLVWLAILLATLGGAAGGLSHPRTGGRRAAVQAGNVARFNREVYAYSSNLSLAQEARRYTIMVLQAPYGRLVARLHRYNPRLQVYMYQFILFARADDPRGLELCTSLPAVGAHNWFLRGPNGQPLRRWAAYGVDMGIPSFQRACAAHAIALARRFRFDGVFLDGVGALPAYDFGGPVTVPKYRTPRSWTTAMTSFLRTMSGAVHARGLKVIANIGGPQSWLQWSALLDGAMEESWTDGGLGPAQQLPWWTEKLQHVAWSEAHGKYVLLHSFSSGESGNIYGLASMLLIANGLVTYSTSNINYVGAEQWFPDYQTAEQLGTPNGHYRRLRSGVYERKFANGLVLVNPTLRSVAGIRLHGAYSGSGLSHVGAVSLPPTSGLILLRG
jgi:hypothetical protein